MAAQTLAPALLRGWPLPEPDPAGDKGERGIALVVGGSAEMPGAAILAGTAALRAGAGKLRIATPRSAALAVGALLEARVYALAETGEGGVQHRESRRVGELAEHAQGVVVGPGMIDPTATERFARRLAERFPVGGPTLVLDAGALPALADQPDLLRRLDGRAIVTPHADEMARMTGLDADRIRAEPLRVALRAAAEWGAVVVLKGGTTHIAAPDGRSWIWHGDNPGLATSGSGDVLAGLVVGLAARGADPAQAACWAVALHGLAGARLAERVGPLGFLARELADEVPGELQRLAASG